MILNQNSKISLRRVYAIVIAVCWVATHVVWFATNKDALPISYVAVDGSVILFYFGKKMADGLQITKKK